MSVSACARAHYPPRRKERELVRLRRFSFLRDLIVFWSWLIPLALECGYDSSRTPEQVEYAWAAQRVRGLPEFVGVVQVGCGCIIVRHVSFRSLLFRCQTLGSTGD